MLTPDDIMAGARPSGPVVVFDDEHYYMGGVVAEALRLAGCDVTLVTPANEVSTWATNTDEQYRIQQRLLQLDVALETGVSLTQVDDESVQLECIYTSRRRESAAATVVMVTARVPQDALYRSLTGRCVIERIGDCDAPGTIASAVYAGHRYAREMDGDESNTRGFHRE